MEEEHVEFMEDIEEDFGAYIIEEGNYSEEFFIYRLKNCQLARDYGWNPGFYARKGRSTIIGPEGSVEEVEQKLLKRIPEDMKKEEFYAKEEIKNLEKKIRDIEKTKEKILKAKSFAKFKVKE